MLDRNRFEKKGGGSAPKVTSHFYGHFIYLHTDFIYKGELSTQFINGSLIKAFTSILSVEQKNVCNLRTQLNVYLYEYLKNPIA